MKIFKIALIAATLAVGAGGTAAEARHYDHGHGGYHHGYHGSYGGRYRHWDRRGYHGYHRPYYRHHGYYRRHWR